MIKHLNAAFTVLLLPCLALDPTLASGLCTIDIQHVTTVSVFNNQALTAAAAMEHRPLLTAAAFHLRKAGRALLNLRAWPMAFFGGLTMDMHDDGTVQKLTELTAVVSEFIREAGADLMAHREEARQSASEKENGTVVTHMDFEIQKRFFERVLTDPRFMDVYIDAEENLKMVGIPAELITRNEANFEKARIRIVLDPIDGTRTYARTQDPTYCIPAAILLDGYPIATALNAPETKERYNFDTDHKPLKSPSLNPGRILACGLRWGTANRSLADTLSSRFEVVDRFKSIALAIARMAAGQPGSNYGGVIAMGLPTNDTIPAAAMLQLHGLKVVRPDGSPFFPVLWKDLTPEAREHSSFIAGTPDVVEQLVKIVAETTARS